MDVVWECCWVEQEAVFSPLPHREDLHWLQLRDVLRDVLNPTWLSCLQCREPTSSAVLIPNRFDMDSKFWEVLTGMILCIKRSFGGLKALELTHSPSCVPATSLPGWSSISAGLWSCRNFGYNRMQQHLLKWSGCAVILSCLCLGLEYFGFWFPALDLRADNWTASKPGVT